MVLDLLHVPVNFNRTDPERFHVPWARSKKSLLICHLQGVIAELTVSRHVVVPKWSKSVLCGLSILSGLHLCFQHLHLVPRFANFSFFIAIVISIHCGGSKDVLSSPTSRVRGER